ncbi:hypothetical protein [Methylorubrum extorquens]|uniref:hypothetical protein n=1 Tax=Methylorubrum extorquens TaxID=408 RepID=UPI00209F8034|nr:hypothetical protein [Methylorubrum extorquens]MCP1540029.1 hypothetical protein [Methylorubrum extorquens]
MTLIKTYSPKNEALIVCPIFGAETKIADCFALEQQLARGKIQDERRGCQACIRGSKCPIYWINRDIQRTGNDHYHASEPKVVALRPEILDQIGPIIVREQTMNELGVGGAEAQAIAAMNDAAGTGSARKSARKAASVTLAPVKPASAPKPAEDDELTKAAISGDLSAAVTKAAAKAAEPVKPAPAPKTPAPAPKPPAPAPAAPKPAPEPAPAGKGMSLLEMARARQAAKAAA